MALLGEIMIQDLGRVSYAQALDRQRAVHAQVRTGDRPPTVLMVEHDPVITLSKRPGVQSHLLADGQRLSREGVELCKTDRGGDITYHGPGQLVVYPILPLKNLQMNVRQYVRSLERAMVVTLGRFGLNARGDEQAVGVWVDQAKIGAIGVRVERWITMHGLALNITTQLAHFDLIVPCGLRRPVTSMERELGEACPSMAQVKTQLGQSLISAWAPGKG